MVAITALVVPSITVTPQVKGLWPKLHPAVVNPSVDRVGGDDKRVGNGDGIDDCVGAAVDHGYGITGCSAEADVNAIVVWIYRNSRGAAGNCDVSNQVLCVGWNQASGR